MQSDTKARVGIIGAGPAGLATAVALQRYAPRGSVEVTVLDRHRGPADSPGLEYGIQARAMRALHRVGADGAARERGRPVDRFDFHHRDGRRQVTVRVDPEWSIGVLRREFLADLAALVDAPILREHRVSTVDVLDGGLGVRVGFADGREGREFDVLVAADGIGSMVRSTFFPEHTSTRPRGISMVYVLADATDVPDEVLPPGFLEIADGSTIRFVRGAFATSVWFPAGRRRVTLALGADDASRARLWAEQGLAPATPWAGIDGATRAALARRIAADTPGPDGFFLRALDLVTDWTSPDVYLWTLRDNDPLPRPYTDHAPVVAIGDAAHAFLPTLGMGASLAIEDGERLARLLGRHLNRGAAPHRLHSDVLLPFGRQRYPVWVDLVHRSRAGLTNWRHETVDQGYVVSPFVPTRPGSALVRGYERLRGRTILPTRGLRSARNARRST